MEKFITTQLLGSGWTAVMYWLNTEDFPTSPFWEPWTTGVGRYTTEGEAEEEAMSWAFADDVEYIVAIDTGTRSEEILAERQKEVAN